MAGSSQQTTNLRPRVSAKTVTSEHGQAYGAGFDLARSKLDLDDANVATVRQISRSGNTVPGGNAGLELDGQAMMDIDSSAATLHVRSGNTVYQFITSNTSAIA